MCIFLVTLDELHRFEVLKGPAVQEIPICKIFKAQCRCNFMLQGSRSGLGASAASFLSMLRAPGLGASSCFVDGLGGGAAAREPWIL